MTDLHKLNPIFPREMDTGHGIIERQGGEAKTAAWHDLLRRARLMVGVMEGLTGCRGDDEWVWALKDDLDASLATLPAVVEEAVKGEREACAQVCDGLERFTPGVMGAIVSAMASRHRRYLDMGAPDEQAKSDYDAAVWLADNMPSIRKAARARSLP